MSKRKKSQKQNSEARQSAPVHTNAASGQMSADELQHMIANAIMEAEDIKAKREADKKEAELAEWHKVIGYDKSKTGIAKVWNGFSSTVKAMFVPKKYIKGDRTSTALIQLLLKSCFQVLRCICSILMLLLIATIPLSFTSSLIPRLNWSQIVFCVLMSILMLMISRLFRIASIEAGKMEDRNNLYGLFASIASIISIVIAVIAIVKGK